MSDTGKPGWKAIPIAGIIAEPGNSERYKTGDWRTFRPIWDPEKCNHCMLCWVYCPDSAIIAQDGKIVAFDYEHCKGCGICAHECPPKVHAIELAAEGEVAQ